MTELELITKNLDKIGNELYNKFGTESYDIRCELHDIKDQYKAINYTRCCEELREEYLQPELDKYKNIKVEIMTKENKNTEKQCDIHVVGSSKRFGEKTKFHYISPKTSERHIKEFEFMADAYYWGMKNLDTSLDWQIVEL